jgi:hypothetical protein
LRAKHAVACRIDQARAGEGQNFLDF